MFLIFQFFSCAGNKSSPLSDVSIPESRSSFPPPPSANPAVSRENSQSHQQQQHSTQSPPQAAHVQSSQHSTTVPTAGGSGGEAGRPPVAGLISQNRYSTEYSPQYPSAAAVAAENNG